MFAREKHLDKDMEECLVLVSFLVCVCVCAYVYVCVCVSRVCTCVCTCRSQKLILVSSSMGLHFIFFRLAPLLNLELLYVSPCMYVCIGICMCT